MTGRATKSTQIKPKTAAIQTLQVGAALAFAPGSGSVFKPSFQVCNVNHARIK